VIQLVSPDVTLLLSQTRVIFFRIPLPVPLATYPIGEGRGTTRRKVPSRDGYPRVSSRVVQRWWEMKTREHSASGTADHVEQLVTEDSR
jgi:hypothetical protein